MLELRRMRIVSDDVLKSVQFSDYFHVQYEESYALSLKKHERKERRIKNKKMYKDNRRQ